MIESQFELDLAEAASIGFRLHRLEVLNWGTFDKKVWTLVLDGKNHLLTGDIGTGKSTLVDAVSTLLVPPHRVAYNKAAGASARERSLRSYVMGHYRTERSSYSDAVAKPVSLRDHNSYSVVLGVFRNPAYNQTVSLAQVFWLADPHTQPKRFYAASLEELSIRGDFARFGTDIQQLRKRLRKRGVELWESFRPYGAWFRRRFRIHNEQALDLFHQTVSMKSVGNLTDFVRSHMLEPFDAETRIEALIGHFDDLSRAHEAVLRAKRKIRMLEPLVAKCDQHAEHEAELVQMAQNREALGPYFARLKIGFLNEFIDGLKAELGRSSAQIQRGESRRQDLLAEVEELRSAIRENGGDRIERLANDIESAVRLRRQREEKARLYADLVRVVDGQMPTDEKEFDEQRRGFSELRESLNADLEQLQNDLTEHLVERSQIREKFDNVGIEIASLKARRTNIPSKEIEMRSRICEALELAEEDVPFVGELIRVRDGESAWEGPAERLLRNFGLALLVRDDHYARVAEWVDATELRKRMVYFRARERRPEAFELHPDSLVKKLALKPDSAFYDWLEIELARRFDVACCATQEQFRREPHALTRAGQIKTRGERHEKDDRYRIDDRSRFVLGWTNAAKIQALESERGALKQRLDDLDARIARFRTAQADIQRQLEALSKLEEYRNYEELDWEPLAAEIARMNDEKRRLETASEVLHELNARLVEAKRAVEVLDAALIAQRDKQSKTQQRQADAEQTRCSIRSELEGLDLEAMEPSFETLGELRAEIPSEQVLRLETCDPRERECRQWIGAHVDKLNKVREQLQGQILVAMKDFKAEFSLETAEIDASVEAAGEYQDMLQRLSDDDLPRFEAKFKQLLNENTIREVANFQSQLDRERETIKERISHINGSLAEIQYNKNRYIKLEAESTQDAEIRDFRKDLRTCTEGALTGSEDDQYSERKFMEVEKIIGRLRAREDKTELDRRWAAKVTDVRNWFVFGASERWCEDDSEYEHYTDSSGKSGGQKEKLAYTILAASLAYQFGLEWGAVRSRSFRFVVIDEAFGRGSDESARYGLSLFSKLNLQLLIVTPLQKTHIIEPFVASVGYVTIEDGQASRLRNLSIEEYREDKRRHQGGSGRDEADATEVETGEPVPGPEPVEVE